MKRNQHTQPRQSTIETPSLRERVQAYRENFRVAMQELLNGQQTASPQPQLAYAGSMNNAGSYPLAQPVARETVVYAKEASTSKDVYSDSGKSTAYSPVTTAPNFGASSSGAAYGDEKSKTIIAQDVEIIGSIKTKGNLDIFGSVQGDIEAAGHIALTGSVTGNVIANSAALTKGTLEGERIQVKTDIRIESESVITAQVTAQNITVDGKVKGSINASSHVAINANATVEGDVSANTISIERGAQIIGAMQTNVTSAVAEPAAKAQPKE